MDEKVTETAPSEAGSEIYVGTGSGLVASGKTTSYVPEPNYLRASAIKAEADARERVVKKAAFIQFLSSTGLPFAVCCKKVGFSTSAFAAWRREDPEFADAVKQAELDGYAALEASVAQAGVGTKDRPGDWRATARYLETRMPETWGTSRVKSDANVVAKVDATVESGPATLAASDRIAARLAELAHKLGAGGSAGGCGDVTAGTGAAVLPILSAIDRPAGSSGQS